MMQASPYALYASFNVIIRYQEFLSGLCAAEAEHARGAGEEGAGLAQGDWSQMRCKVEEGYGRVSTVLEDGTIQVRLWGEKNVNDRPSVKAWPLFLKRI